MTWLFEPSHDFGLAVGEGLIENMKQYGFFGRSQTLVADTLTDLSALSVNTIPLPSNSGESLEIVSDDITDIGQTIRIRALGPDATESDPVDVTLNGTTAVSIPGSISRINAAFNSGLTAFAGNVSIQQAGAGTVFGIMPASHQQLNNCLFTIPAGYRWYPCYVIAGMNKGGAQEASVEFRLTIKYFASAAWRMPFSFGVQRGGDSQVEFRNQYAETLTGPADVKFVARADADGPIAGCYASGPYYVR